ncbi:MAG: LITAF-like zinc ribbon domain-containing protein [Candidatus Lokiarchaeota archaeon]
MSKKKMDKHAFCPKCLKEVKPKRKKLDNFNYQLWIIIIISSLGFAIIPLLIYYFFIRKKKYCPKCGRKLRKTLRFALIVELH